MLKQFLHFFSVKFPQDCGPARADLLVFSELSSVFNVRVARTPTAGLGTLCIASDRTEAPGPGQHLIAQLHMVPLGLKLVLLKLYLYVGHGSFFTFFFFLKNFFPL